jgi:transaldolase
MYYYPVIMITQFQTKIFADGANLVDIALLAKDPLISGFTTNPTLMRSAGVQDYLSFSQEAIEIIGDRPISLEVFADEMNEMIRQGELLHKLGDNVFVKIPITNTKGESTSQVVQALTAQGVKVNVTAIFTIDQANRILERVQGSTQFYLSVFAGRIADAGVNPVPIIKQTVELLSEFGSGEVIWASPREVYNFVEAQNSGCQIITMTRELISKLTGLGKDLDQFSLETVKMFANDALNAGYIL